MRESNVAAPAADSAAVDAAAFLFCNHISAAVLALFSVCNYVCVCVCVCVKCCPALIFMISFMVSVYVFVCVSVTVAVSAQFQFYVSPLIIHTAKAALDVILVVVVMQCSTV